IPVASCNCRERSLALICLSGPCIWQRSWPVFNSMSTTFDRRIHETVSDPQLQLKIYTATSRLIEGRKSSISSDKLPEYEALRDQANAVKKHTIDNLDYYLEQFERAVVAHGGKVIFCKDGAEVADFVLGLAKER